MLHHFQVLWSATTLYTGPLTKVTNGIDISFLSAFFPGDSPLLRVGEDCDAGYRKGSPRGRGSQGSGLQLLRSA